MFPKAFSKIFWSGERLAAPGSTGYLGFTALRPEDIVYVECSIGRQGGDVVFILEAIHFLARPPKHM